MRIVLILFCCLSSMQLIGQKHTQKAILDILTEIIINAEGKLELKYKNSRLIQILEKQYAQKLELELSQLDASDESVIEKLGFIGKDDEVIFEKYTFIYSKILGKLKRKNNKRIRAKKDRRLLKKQLFISTPILSKNGKHALVYVQTKCGPLCGTEEIFVFVIRDKRWMLEDRIIKAIS